MPIPKKLKPYTGAMRRAHGRYKLDAWLTAEAGARLNRIAPRYGSKTRTVDVALQLLEEWLRREDAKKVAE